MIAKLLTGKPITDKMIEILLSRVAQLASVGVRPCLAVVRAGERPDDVAYEDSIAKRAEALGVVLRRETLSADADTSRIKKAVQSLAANDSVHGILVFRPLPTQTDEAAVLAAIPPAKDVDGVTKAQMAGLYAMKKSANEVGDEGADSPLFFPCTAEAVIRMLDHYDIPIGGKRVVVVGRSTVIGKSAAHLLLSRDATVTICHSRTKNIAELTREADIVVCAAGLATGGRANRLGAEYFAPGQTVIDVAVNADGEGIYGDVDTDAAGSIVANITPVPGGLGAVTTLTVIEHTIRAAETRG
ncbi:MAG: bifunctional 5,10-methylenetetrahydrofolate dehydrogenase/5,10-methenyltetrahydrofolate cyclohydrolase [Clostridiales Family XIII bacterium]|jgi:methylenetetrahydrofolate dehydrogenase (NADP+)/methenyltetrahydrofolate cyclohydrolase|nr:bifunctional 5,10-methylenetetrahydrofolate dehydrogenase/5,10-methenyltetrahydrofolate cyclohydrolase [Clostridiales Family XIII bacterium]